MAKPLNSDSRDTESSTVPKDQLFFNRMKGRLQIVPHARFNGSTLDSAFTLVEDPIALYGEPRKLGTRSEDVGLSRPRS